MRSILIPLFLVCCFSTPAVAQTDWPLCELAASDPDRDGFGYENNSTCLVSSSSQSPTAGALTCIDEDNDGWGWNGVESCQVTAAPPVVTNACFDTDPADDGWGWDGVQSCRVSEGTGSGDIDTGLGDQTTVDPSSEADNTRIDELALIRSKFGANESMYFPGWNRTGVAIRCAAESNRSEQLFFLFADGELKLLNGWGQWSGGWHNDDDTLHFLWRRFDDVLMRSSTANISESGVRIDGGRECTWVDS